MKVLMLKGLPASGKSTYAKELVSQGWKRVNRDDLRSMVDNGKWSYDNEKLIRNLRDLHIVEYLSAGKNVVIDDTNLDPKLEKHFQDLTVSFKPEFEVKFFNTSVDECVKRDLKRSISVGGSVIRNMYHMYLQPKPILEYDDTHPYTIICDLDGTLCLLDGRNPYDASECEKDSVNEPVRSILQTYISYFEEEFFVTFCSGREDKYKEETLRWLSKYFRNGSYQLHMRKTGDSRKDAIIKKEIYDANIKDKLNVLFVLDDRNQVVDMWRDQGLTCLQVNYGDF